MKPLKHLHIVVVCGSKVLYILQAMLQGMEFRNVKVVPYAKIEDVSYSAIPLDFGVLRSS
jgi:hypothetical protein